MVHWRRHAGRVLGRALLLALAACVPGVDRVQQLNAGPALATAPASAVAPPDRPWSQPLSSRMPDGEGIGASPAPWLAFCGEDPQRHRCWDPPATVALTPERLAELATVQEQVNATVTQIEELVAAGDHWTLVGSTGTGDCEDLALTKRDRLIRAGWPAGALRMGLCYTWTQPVGGDALHAVLTVDTDEGTLVLGNLAGRVAPWAASECRDWVMRSSGEAWAWVDGGVRAPIRPVAEADGR